MMIRQSLRTGLAQAWAHKRIILIYYLTNLLLGLLLLLPIRGVLGDFLGKSAMGQVLGGRLDMNFIFDLFKQRSDLPSIFTSTAPLAVVLYWLALIFLSGGAFSLLRQSTSYSAAAFWGNCGAYFSRFIRLSVWALPFLALFLVLPLAQAGLRRLVFGGDPYQYVTYWSGWIGYGLTTLSFILFGMVLDYARIIAVRSEEKRMRRTVWQAFKFSLRHLFSTTGLALSIFLAGAILLLIYSQLADLLWAANGFVVLLLFLVQQGYMLLRAGLRIALFSSQGHLFEGLAAAPSETPATDTAHELGLEGASA